MQDKNSLLILYKSFKPVKYIKLAQVAEGDQLHIKTKDLNSITQYQQKQHHHHQTIEINQDLSTNFSFMLVRNEDKIFIVFTQGNWREFNTNKVVNLGQFYQFSSNQQYCIQQDELVVIFGNNEDVQDQSVQDSEQGQQFQEMLQMQQDCYDKEKEVIQNSSLMIRATKKQLIDDGTTTVFVKRTKFT